MNTRYPLFHSLAILLTVWTVTPSEEPRAASEVVKPAALTEAIDHHFPGSVVDMVQSSLVLGMPVYLITLHQDGRDILVEVGADGRLLTARRESRIQLLPDAARDALPATLRSSETRVYQLDIRYNPLVHTGPLTRYVVEGPTQTWIFESNGSPIAVIPSLPSRSGPSHPRSSEFVERVPSEEAPPAAANSMTTPNPPNSQARQQAESDDSNGDQVIPIAQVRRGQAVVLRGEVVRLRGDDEFILRDDSGSIEVYIGWRNQMPVSSGQIVTVSGRADDDTLPGFRPDVYARHIILPNGQRVNLRNDSDDEK